ncbi:MAG TPA: hypothetical protein VHL31_04250 [Geminicoccus sp.]|jgi:hypothetical protein|uniref:hypothetical protein n=1 Tax=Geminicoccus sp. TaxID=2024832 RepID=UPI002E336EA7|nr:hypothetical protein [Geminicoccus sp.]HEX2525500.1 hypothetical protein [Geminicoccus sp.]
MNRTSKDATIRSFHDPDLEALQVYVSAFVTAYHVAKHLKAFAGGHPSRSSATPEKAV